MGWASGSVIGRDIIKLAKKHIPNTKRGAFYRGLINALADQDCDTLDACMGLDAVFDAELEKRWATR